MHNLKFFFLAIFMAIFLVGCGSGKAPKVAKVLQVPKTMASVDCDGMAPADRQVCWAAKAREASQMADKARREKEKVEPKAMQDVRREEARAEQNRQKAEREMREAVAYAGISGCPVGSVWVSPDAEKRPWAFVHVRYNVFNDNSVHIEIKDDLTGQIIVKNLCPGGRMAMTKIISMWGEGRSTPVSYTAIGEISGRPAIVHSPTTTLVIDSAQYQTAQIVNWDIRLYLR